MQNSNLWDSKLAERTGLMKSSAVRELLKLTTQPEMISFAGGLPAPELFPMETLGTAINRVLARESSQCLQYGETEGLGGLRDWVAQHLSTPKKKLTRDSVVITSGAQQGLDLLGRILLDPTDTVLVENPTYLALLASWRPLGVAFRAVASDAQGLRLDALRDALQSGPTPKCLYTIPNFQNPQGTTLSADRREELVVEMRARQIGIIEDDPYGALRYEGTAPSSLLELDGAPAGSDPEESNVIQTGTFSKLLAPGLRVGWVVGPPSVIRKLVLSKQAADLHTGSLSQHVILEWLQAGHLEDQIARLRATYKQRRDLMLAALEKHFPSEVQWTKPEGGMFLFVTLPTSLSANEVLRKSIEHKVAFVPGGDFHADGSGQNTLRLNFSHPSPDKIEVGVQRLAEVLKETLRGG